MIPVFRFFTRTLNSELIASTAALVKRLIPRKPNMIPAATSRMALPNMGSVPPFCFDALRLLQIDHAASEECLVVQAPVICQQLYQQVSHALYGSPARDVYPSLQAPYAFMNTSTPASTAASMSSRLTLSATPNRTCLNTQLWQRSQKCPAARIGSGALSAPAISSARSSSASRVTPHKGPAS